MSKVWDTRRRDEILDDSIRSDTVDKEYNVFGSHKTNDKFNSSLKNDVLKGQLQLGKLSSAYFSAKNIQIIQNALRAEVFESTKEVISEQSERELLIVMRSIYYQFSTNNDNNVREQIEYLNGIVIKQIVPSIVTAIEFHQYYLDHHLAVPEPMEQPVNNNIRGTYNNTFHDPGF